MSDCSFEIWKKEKYMRGLMKYLIKRPILFIITVFLSIFYAFSMPGLSLIMEWIINGLLKKEEFGMNQVLICMLFLIALLVLRLITN